MIENSRRRTQAAKRRRIVLTLSALAIVFFGHATLWLMVAVGITYVILYMLFGD